MPARIAGLQERVVDLVVHHHLGGVGDADLLVEELLGDLLAAQHLPLEELDVDGEREAVVGLDPHQLASGVGDHGPEAVGQLAVPALQLPQEAGRETEPQLVAVVEHVQEHLGRGVVAPAGDLVEVAPVHLVVEEKTGHGPGLGPPRDDARRQQDAAGLMDDAVGDEVLGHDDPLVVLFGGSVGVSLLAVSAPDRAACGASPPGGGFAGGSPTGSPATAAPAVSSAAPAASPRGGPSPSRRRTRRRRSR